MCVICMILFPRNYHSNGVRKREAIEASGAYERPDYTPGPSHCKICQSLVMRKPVFCICEDKDADQLRGNREADQRLCFCYTDSTIPLLPKFKISSL